MQNSLLEPTLYTVKGMLILDNDGNRILAKYYDKNVFPTPKEQKAFEKNLFTKTHRANAEIIMLDGLTCVYKSNVDLFFYVMGSTHENELILMSVLNCFYDAVSQILRKNVEKRVVLENLDIVMLAMDEICDGGASNHTPGLIKQLYSFMLKYSSGTNDLATHRLLIISLFYKTNSDPHSLIPFNKIIESPDLKVVDLVNFMFQVSNSCYRIILEADGSQVVQRVALRTDDIPIGEQTVAQVLQSAKEQLKWSLLK